MKKYIMRLFSIVKPTFVMLLLLLVIMGYGQKEPQYTQYMYNIGSFNPAYVSTVATPEIAGLYRSQWLNMPGAPRTIRLGANVPLNNEKHGFGFNVVNDQLGPVAQTYFDLAYSYQVNLSNHTLLSFGVDVGGSALNVDFSKGTFENPGEPILNRETINKFYPTIGAGLFLYSDDWYLGTSVPNFLTEGVYNTDVAQVIEDRLQFNIIGGYVFNVSDNLKFKPAFLINAMSGNPINVNLSANFLISKVFTAGVSYRLENSFSGLAGFQVSPSFFVGYAYDYNTNLLGDFNNGSHEIILKFYLGASGENKTEKTKREELKDKPKQIDSPRFF